MGNEYWNQNTAGLRAGIGNVGAAIGNAPRLRQQTELRRQMLILAQQRAASQGQEEQARAGLLTAQTGTENTKNDAAKFQLEQVRNVTKALLASGAMKISPDGTTVLSPEATPIILSGLVGSSKGGNDASGAIATLLKSKNDPVEADLNRSNNTSKALAVQAAKDAATSQRPFNLNAGAARYNPDGTLLVERPSASLENKNSDTVKETYPEVPAVDAVPASSGFLGMGKHDAAPAVPYQPAKVVTKRVPRDGTNAPAAPQAESAPPLQQRVKGKTYQTPKGIFTWTGQGWTQ